MVNANLVGKSSLYIISAAITNPIKAVGPCCLWSYCSPEYRDIT